VQVFLPDSEGVLTVSRRMFYNDTPWLAGSGQPMVHRDIPNDVAEALGCLSLRYHEQVGPAIPLVLFQNSAFVFALV